jgi:hypothetical protein
VHAVGEHERLADDAAAVADALDLRVQPQIRVAALERPVTERVHLLVQPWQIRDTSDFEIRNPSDSTTWSTLRVETPATYASCTTDTSACSERRRASRKLGK